MQKEEIYSASCILSLGNDGISMLNMSFTSCNAFVDVTDIFSAKVFFTKKVTKGCRQTMAHTTRTHDTNWHRKAPLSSSSSAASSSTSRERSYSLYFGIARIRQLHWLPVRRRVDFKISTLVYRSLAGTAPVFLADECTLVTAVGRRPLRSADNRTCLVVKRSR